MISWFEVVYTPTHYLKMQRLVVFFLLASLGLGCLAVYEYTDPFTGNCLACDPTCKSCFNSTYCLQCAEEHYLTGSFSCGRCSFGCKVCTGATGCSTCNDGLYLTSAGECLSCDNGVATCTIATVQTCSDGFFLLSSICAGCFSNCKTCTNFVSCTECALGYYLTGSGTSCAACPSNCQVAQMPPPVLPAPLVTHRAVGHVQHTAAALFTPSVPVVRPLSASAARRAPTSPVAAASQEAVCCACNRQGFTTPTVSRPPMGVRPTQLCRVTEAVS